MRRWTRKDPEASALHKELQAIKDCRVGDIVLPKEDTTIGYPISNLQPWKYTYKKQYIDRAGLPRE